MNRAAIDQRVAGVVGQHTDTAARVHDDIGSDGYRIAWIGERGAGRRIVKDVGIYELVGHGGSPIVD